MTSIYDASTTAASNTTVGGININTGWPPSNVGPATREIIAETKGALVGITASGTDTYTATMAPTPSALVDGMSVAVRFTNANTSTTPTFNLNSLGAKTIKKDGGSAVAAGDIPAGHEAILRYRTSDTSWILLNPKVSTTTFASASLTLTAGNGLTGGGDLSANRSFAVGAGTGIVSNADDVAVDKATQANMEAETSNKVVTADVQKYHPGAVKAAAKITSSAGTYSLARGYNVSGTITKNGTGDITISFTTAFSDANYAVNLSFEDDSGGTAINHIFIKNGGQASGSLNIITLNSSGTAVDLPAIHVNCTGDFA